MTLVLLSGLLVALSAMQGPTAWAGETGSAETKELEMRLQAGIEKYNRVTSSEDSSMEDVMECVDQIDQIVEEVKGLGMDVDFEQASDVHVNSKGEPMPANLSGKIVPAAAIASQGYSFTANESQMEVLNEIYGTDISMGEFMAKVFPESLDVLPRDTLIRYYMTPMIWPDPEGITPGLKTISSHAGYNSCFASGIRGFSSWMNSGVFVRRLRALP